MKSTSLPNKAAAFTGRTLLRCYRLYILVFKETSVYQPADTARDRGHKRFTSKQFKTPCYN